MNLYVFVFLNLSINLAGFSMIVLRKGLLAVVIKIQTKLDYQECSETLKPNFIPFKYLGTYNCLLNLFQLSFQYIGNFSGSWDPNFDERNFYLILAVMCLLPLLYSLFKFHENKVEFRF